MPFSEGSHERLGAGAASVENSAITGLALIRSESMLGKYSSMRTKLRRFLQKFETVFFSSVFATVQENQFRVKFWLVGMIIDFLQVFALTMSSDFLWNQSYDNVSQIMISPMLYLTWEVYQILFYIAVLLVVSGIAVALYVGYSFALGDYSHVLPMKYSRTITNLLVGVLFIPILTILLLPWKRDSSGFLASFPEVPVSEAMLPGIVGILCLLIFVPFCLILGLFNFELARDTKDRMARHNSYIDFVYLVLKAAMIFMANLAPVNVVGIRLGLIGLSVVAVAVALVLIVPYYSKLTNILRTFLAFSLVGAFISTTLNYTTGLYANYGVLSVVIHIAVSLGIGCFGSFVMTLRIHFLTSTQRLLVYVSPKKAAITSMASPSASRALSQNPNVARSLNMNMKGVHSHSPKAMPRHGSAGIGKGKRKGKVRSPSAQSLTLSGNNINANTGPRVLQTSTSATSGGDASVSDDDSGSSSPSLSGIQWRSRSRGQEGLDGGLELNKLDATMGQGDGGESELERDKDFGQGVFDGRRQTTNTYPSHPHTHTHTQRPSTISMSAGAEKQGILDSLKAFYTRTLNYFAACTTVARTMCVEKEKYGLGVTHVQLADTVFQHDINRYTGSTLHIIHYSNFVLDYKKDWIAAQAQLRRAVGMGIKAYERYLCFSISKRSERQRRAASVRVGHDRSNLNLMKYVDFQRQMARAKRYHARSLRHLRMLFESILTLRGKNLVDKVNVQQEKATSTRELALKAYASLLSSFPSSPILWRSYGTFLQDVCGVKEEADKAFNTADEIEETVMVKQTEMLTRVSLDRYRTGQGQPQAPQHVRSPLHHRDEQQDMDGQAQVPVQEQALDLNQSDQSDNSLDARSDARSQVSDIRSRVTGGTNANTNTGTGTGSSLSTAAMRSVTARKTVKRLKSSMLKTLAALMYTFACTFLSTLFLMTFVNQAVGTQDYTITTHIMSQYAALQCENLVKAYANTTLSYATVKTMAAELKVTIANVTASLEELYGNRFARGTQESWDNVYGALFRYPPSPGSFSTPQPAYIAIRKFVDSLTSIVGLIENPDVDHTQARLSIWQNTDVSLVMGSVQSVGSIWQRFIDHQITGVFDNLLQLNSYVPAMTIVVAQVVVVFAFYSFIYPALREVHNEQHRVHSMLSIVDLDQIYSVIVRLAQMEKKVLGYDQDSDVGDINDFTDNEEKLDEVVVNVSKPTHRRRAIKGGNYELFVVEQTKKYSTSSNTLKKLLYRSVIPILLINTFVFADIMLFIFTIPVPTHVRVQSMSQVANRYNQIVDAAWMAELLPYRGVVENEWGLKSSVSHEISTIRDGILDAHTRVLWGTKNISFYDQTTTNAAMLKVHPISQGIAEYREVLDKLVFAARLVPTNQSLSLESSPYLEQVGSLVMSPGTLRENLTESVLGYRDISMRASKGAVVLQGIMLLAFMVVILPFVGYVVIIKGTISRLTEMIASAERTLQLVPHGALTSNPLIYLYLRDKQAFMAKLKEIEADENDKDKKEKESEMEKEKEREREEERERERNELLWCRAFLEHSDDPMIAVSSTGTGGGKNDGKGKEKERRYKIVLMNKTARATMVTAQYIDECVMMSHRSKLLKEIRQAEKECAARSKSRMGKSASLDLLAIRGDRLGSILMSCRIRGVCVNVSDQKQKQKPVIVTTWKEVSINDTATTHAPGGTVVDFASVMWANMSLVEVSEEGEVLRMSKKAESILKSKSTDNDSETDKAVFSELFDTASKQTIDRLVMTAMANNNLNEASSQSLSQSKSKPKPKSIQIPPVTLTTVGGDVVSVYVNDSGQCHTNSGCVVFYVEVIDKA